VLERKGALENAIVIALTDHGESLGEPSPIAEQNAVLDRILGTDAIAGHGTHVFSKAQYNVLLGFRSYGNARIEAAPGSTIGYPVSLVDLTPTVLDVLGLEPGRQFDGISLLPYIAGNPAPEAADRPRFLETEFNPPGIMPGMFIATSAIVSAADKYRIDPDSGRVLVRTEFVDEILGTRQYAVEQHGEILATVPAVGDFRKQHLLHFDAATEQVSWLDAPPSAEADRTEYELWQLLQQRFDQVRDRPVVPLPDVTASAPAL